MQSTDERVTIQGHTLHWYESGRGTPVVLLHGGGGTGRAFQAQLDRLSERGIRVQVDASADRMQKKIRTAQKQKVPFMLIAGDADVSEGAVSFRYRDGSQKNGVPLAEAVAEIVAAVRDRVQV